MWGFSLNESNKLKHSSIAALMLYFGQVDVGLFLEIYSWYKRVYEVPLSNLFFSNIKMYRFILEEKKPMRIIGSLREDAEASFHRTFSIYYSKIYCVHHANVSEAKFTNYIPNINYVILTKIHVLSQSPSLHS